MSARQNRGEQRWQHRYDDQIRTGPARCEVLDVDNNHVTVTVGEWDDYERTPHATVRWVSPTDNTPDTGDHGWLHLDARGRPFYALIEATVEPVVIDWTDWADLTLTSDWAHGTPHLQWRRSPQGRVFLRGQVTRTATSALIICTLPVDARPLMTPHQALTRRAAAGQAGTIEYLQVLSGGTDLRLVNSVGTTVQLQIDVSWWAT